MSAVIISGIATELLEIYFEVYFWVLDCKAIHSKAAGMHKHSHTSYTHRKWRNIFCIV